MIVKCINADTIITCKLMNNSLKYVRNYVLFMATISFSDFRRNLAKFLNMAEDDCEEIVIHRSKGRKSILISYDEYRSLAETAYLLSTPANRKHLEKSLKEADRGEFIKVEL